MKHAKFRLPFRSIRSKIIFIVYLVIFPVLIVTEIFIGLRSAQTIKDENTRQYSATAEILNNSIGYFEEDLQDLLTYVIVNSEVESILRSPKNLGLIDPLFWQNASPMRFVTDMLNVKGNIRTFILYPENGLAPYYTSIDGSVMVKNIEAIRDLDIYKRANEALGDTVWGREAANAPSVLFEKNQRDKVLLAREILDRAKSIRLGFMALSIDVAQYEEICRPSLIHPQDGIVIVDGQYNEIARVGQVNESALEHISANMLDSEALTKSAGTQAINGSYVFATPRGNDGWIFYLSPKSTWDAKILGGLLQPVLLGAALLISIWPISLFASRLISKPVSRLHSSMDKFKGGDFSAQVEVVGNDEIAELSETFNHMVHDIKGLIDRSYVLALREKESELTALQAQINPHFLYNALDSLYWQASDAGQEEFAENILALSNLFRLVLSSGQSEITVGQEVELISNYLHIQKMRFSQKLDYSVTVSEDMMNYYIPKLILQPFVENAIVHGLERRDTWGGVQVRGQLANGMLHFVIEDNGTGMPKEKLNEVLFTNTDKRYANQRVGYYAIHNVKERMALSYGSLASLEIQSTVGIGTRVSITVPTHITEGKP